MMRLLQLVLVGLLALTLSACSASQQQSIQTSVDRNVLSYTLGKQYAQIAKSQKMTGGGLLNNDPTYGKLVSKQKLASGDTIYKHVDNNEASSSSVGIGIIGKTDKRIDLRLLYFRVGKDGIIKDHANGTVTGGNVSCIDWIGGLVQDCGNDQLIAKDVAQMDLVVRTSTGGPLSSWQ